MRDERRRAHAHRHADPAHARAVAHRHPRPLAREHAARGPPADPHLRRRVRRPRRRRGDPARAAARGPGVLRAQPRARHRARRRERARARARGAGRRRARPDGRDRGSSGSCSTSAEREFDVLVCTTIVESGIDMPTVNTLVVDRSDLLGLAQLYQLRGRVGRRGQRAYAYLLHPPDRVLSEEAYERLKTIGEFTDLGSGFKIAMRDLEIRGAGNLLGAGAVGPHRRRRLRPLLPDGHRGGRRAQGRAGARCPSRSRSTCRSTPTCRATTSRATTCAWRPTAGWPRSRRRPTSTTSAPSGRTATGRRRRRPPRCSTSPACASVRAARHPRRSRCSAAPRASSGSRCASRRRCGCGGWCRRRWRRTTARSSCRSAPAAHEVAAALVALLEELVPPEADRGGGRRRPRASLRSAMSSPVAPSRAVDRARPRRRVAVAAVVVALVGGDDVSPTAVRVNGSRTTSATLDGELDGFSQGTYFSDLYQQQGLALSGSPGSLVVTRHRAVALVPHADPARRATPRAARHAADRREREHRQAGRSRSRASPRA